MGNNETFYYRASFYKSTVLIWAVLGFQKGEFVARDEVRRFALFHLGHLLFDFFPATDQNQSHSFHPRNPTHFLSSLFLTSGLCLSPLSTLTGSFFSWSPETQRLVRDSSARGPQTVPLLWITLLHRRRRHHSVHVRFWIAVRCWRLLFLYGFFLCKN